MSGWWSARPGSRTRRAAPALVILAFAAGCADPTEPDVPTMTGTWAGTFQVNDSEVILEVTLVERDRVLTGFGAMRGETGGGTATTVRGAHVHPEVSFTGSSSGRPDFNFSGTFQDRLTVDGRLTGGGFTGEQLTLIRRE